MWDIKLNAKNYRTIYFNEFKKFSSRHLNKKKTHTHSTKANSVDVHFINQIENAAIIHRINYVPVYFQQLDCSWMKTRENLEFVWMFWMFDFLSQCLHMKWNEMLSLSLFLSLVCVHYIKCRKICIIISTIAKTLNWKWLTQLFKY